MYFLSFDASTEHLGVDVLDLNPDTTHGKSGRKQIELEFCRLVLVGNSPKHVSQVIELGKIDTGGTHPEKRISSNFLTVPLKKASNQSTPFYYPNRPKAPLLKMGMAATGRTWGVGYHEDWMENLPKMMAGIKSSTPFLDLAIFICRDSALDDGASSIQSAVEPHLRNRFTKDVATFWIGRMAKERVLWRAGGEPFASKHQPFLAAYKNGSKALGSYEAMNKSELIARIMALEAMIGITK